MGLFFILTLSFILNSLFIKPVFTLKANERLKSRKVIQSLFKEGKSFLLFPLRVVYLESKDQASPLQAGFSVSTRQFKKAVDRNKIKRLMRESYRLQKNDLFSHLSDSESLSVFFIYTGKKMPSFTEVFEKIGAAIQRVQKEVKQK